MDAIEFIIDTAAKIGLGLKIGEISGLLAIYRDKEGIWSKRFIWEGMEDINPLTQWRGNCGTNILADVAIRIMSAPVTSAATARSFSTFSWIHIKKRNRLTTERAIKITYLA
ncbi:unnamed protein product [Psylliodes chrysocephalus]|uniref:HAT C-terminal dimerisation domain-containing protein n=1 Tax=Psylliodes chrysocephalus TaxID=3402493 RepID=A0A9P0G7J7_9CUCU|nr:unnamed protein product [Psylliodes chrysocephala]